MEAASLTQAPPAASLRRGPAALAVAAAEGPGDFIDVSFSQCLDKALAPSEPTDATGTHKAGQAGQAGDAPATEESVKASDTAIVADTLAFNLVALLGSSAIQDVPGTGDSFGFEASADARLPATGAVQNPTQWQPGTAPNTFEAASAVEAALEFAQGAGATTMPLSATQGESAVRSAQPLGNAPRDPAQRSPRASKPADTSNVPWSGIAGGVAEDSAERPLAGSDGERSGRRIATQTVSIEPSPTGQGELSPQGRQARRTDTAGGIPADLRQLALWNGSKEHAATQEFAVKRGAFDEALAPISALQAMAVPDLRIGGLRWRSTDADMSPVPGAESEFNPAPVPQAVILAAAPEQVVRLASHPARAEWRGEFLHGMQVLVSDRAQVAELQLNPANMGPVSVQIAISEHQARIIFGISNDDTRRAIEQALPQLRDMLNASGIQLDSASVGDHASRHPGDSPAAARTPRTQAAPAAAPGVPIARQNLHLLDTYA